MLSRVVSAYAKLIAIGHLAAGAALLWLAAWTLAPLAHTLTAGPSRVALLPPLLIVAALSGWFSVLGVRVWRRSSGWSASLRWTHAVVLAVAVLQLVEGWIAIRGAARSAAHGGGLLGGLGDLQVAAGAVLAGFALISLPLTLGAGASARRTRPPTP